MKYTNILYNPVYMTLGVEAEVSCLFGSKFKLTAIDKTSGVEIVSGADVGTIRPAMSVKASELTSLGLRPQDLEEAIVTMNGKEWTVKTTMIRPSPKGEKDGEIFAILMDTSNE